MQTVQIKDKQFEIAIPAATIQQAVKTLAEKISSDLKDTEPIFVVVLNGAFMFASDLLKNISIPCEVSFVKLSSYHGTYSSGKVKELVGLQEDIKGRTVVIVEDIIDTGVTMEMLLHQILSKDPKEVKVASFFLKPEALKKNVPLDYIALRIPNDFIVGYGLDYDGFGRNLADVYSLKK